MKKALGTAVVSVLALGVGAAASSASPLGACVVPRLYGLDLVTARAAVTHSSCSIGGISFEGPHGRVARVTDQVPAPGAILPRHGRVSLIAS